MVLFGSEELEAGSVKIKDMGQKSEDTVPLKDLSADLKKRLEVWRSAHASLLPPPSFSRSEQ